MRGYLNDRDKTIAQMKLDKKTALEALEAAHHRDIERHQDTYNNAVAAHIEKDKKQKDEILSSKINARAHQEAVNGYEWRIMELEKQLQHMQLARGPPPTKRGPDHIPTLKRDAHRDPNYAHTDAPRENRMYKRFTNDPSVVYLANTGKVYPANTAPTRTGILACAVCASCSAMTATS